MTAVSAAIGNSETKLVQYIIPANTLQVGSTFRVTLYGTCTPANSATSNIRVRIGTAGSSSDVAAVNLAPTSATTGTNVPFSVVMMVTVRSTGASGTVDGNGMLTNFSYGTGIESNGVGVGTPIAGATVNTTVSNIIHVSYVTSNNSTKSTFQIATIEAIN